MKNRNFNSRVSTNPAMGASSPAALRRAYPVYDPFGTSRLPENKVKAKVTAEALRTAQTEVEQKLAKQAIYNEWAAKHPIQSAVGVKLTKFSIYGFILVMEIIYMLVKHGTLNPMPALTQLSKFGTG